MFVPVDQLLQGAALNAIRIAERIHQELARNSRQASP